MILQDALKWLASIQFRYARLIFFTALLSTGFMALGVPQIQIQTDFSKELPSHLPVLKLQEKVGEKFGDTDSFVIVVQVDMEAQASDRVVDIREPRVLRMISELHKSLSEEKDINTVFSLATFTQGDIPENLEQSKAMIDGIPQGDLLMNGDFSATAVYANTDVGEKEEDVQELLEVIKEDMASVATPPGLKLSLTGTPVLRSTMLELLVRDATVTILLSAAIILCLLIITNRPVTRALLIFFPLATSMIWLLGSMGWLGIPLSIATVGIGAMILGLGVEYGVFVVRRYHEQRDAGMSQLDSLNATIPGVGLAIFGSASTTTVAFLALLLASMPMIQHMGAALALGIVYSFIGAVVVNPAFIILEENFMEERKHG